MNKANFIKGPWKKQQAQIIKERFETGEVDELIATVNGAFNIGIANAYLIASAPELYEALEKSFYAMLDALDSAEMTCPICLTSDGHEVGCEYMDAMQKAEIALKKARGE